MNVLQELMVSSSVRVGTTFGVAESEPLTHVRAEFRSLYKNLDEFDHDSDDEHLVAKVFCTHLDFDKTDWNIHDFLDTDGGIYDLYHPFFSDRDGLRSFGHSIASQLDVHFNNNIFYIEKLEVSEPFRGKRIGAEIIAYMINQFSQDANIAVLKAYPLEKGLSKTEIKARQKRLKSYYKSLGFKATKNDKDWMFLDLSKEHFFD